MADKNPSASAPEVTSADAVDAIIEVSKRNQYFPLRREFVQRRENGPAIPGPMSALVNAGDRRALILFLLLITKASSAPWDAALPAAAWARALGIDLPDSKTARSTISRTWRRLEQHRLVRRARRDRLADVFLLQEDGQGADYESPGGAGNKYCKVPLALWATGPDDQQRWFQILTLPELAMLLIARTLSDGFWLPVEKGPEWYGISADTVGRGLTGLKAHGVLDFERRFKKAPLSALGYTEERRYTLLPPFGPIGHASGGHPKPTPRKQTLQASTASTSN